MYRITWTDAYGNEKMIVLSTLHQAQKTADTLIRDDGYNDARVSLVTPPAFYNHPTIRLVK